MTEFFEAFPAVKPSLKLEHWRGIVGAAMFSTDEQGYVHVDYWIRPELTATLPPYIEYAESGEANSG